MSHSQGWRIYNTYVDLINRDIGLYFWFSEDQFEKLSLREQKAAVREVMTIYNSRK